MMERSRGPRTGRLTTIWIVSHRLLRRAQRRPRDAGRIALGLAATLLLVTIWIGCAPSQGTRPAPTGAPTTDGQTNNTRITQPPRDPLAELPRISEISGEPTVRVRTHRGVRRVRIDGPLPLTVSPGFSQAARAKSHTLRGRTTITRQTDGALRLRVAGQNTLGWATRVLVIESKAGRVVVDGVAYPGRVLLHTTRNSRAKLDVVNHARLDDYLPGVLERELYPGWHAEAYRAQAVAARSYAIAQSKGARRRGWHYDLESTTASQVYGGSGTRAVALHAVQDTAGLVLAYRGRVVPGYYSSTVGPRGQDAAAAFPHGEDIAPLRGISQAGGDTASPHYQWGPVRRPTAQLARRIAAWGRANQSPVAAMSGLRAIAVQERNAAGRPTRFLLTDARGKTFTLGPERFRFACNFDAPGLPRITGKARIKSADLAATVTATTTALQGHGFGHGVGMSQWGAQQLAKRGQRYPQILGRYYPGAKLQRVY